jgi:hypothetical protein
MIYAIEVNGKVELHNVQETSSIPQGAIISGAANYYGTDTSLLKIVDGSIMFKTLEDLQAERDAQAVAQAIADQVAEEAFQANKSDVLKSLENIYASFLTDMWTPALVNLGIIPADTTITHFNTDAVTNMGYLMQMRVINYAQYDLMAGEFDRLKQAIIDAGGDMSRIKVHV